jgi:AraC-like DNA-binding protein
VSATSRSQPAAAGEPSGFAFVVPAADLKPFVRGMLDVRINDPAVMDKPRLRQPPEPALGLVFHYGAPMRVTLDGMLERRMRSHVTGLHEVAHAVGATGPGGMVSVGLTPLGAACFQGGPMRLFTHQRIPMEDVVRVNWVREVEARLAAQPDRAGRVACVHAALRQLLVPHKRDDFVAWAADHIWENGGRFRVDELALRAGLSSRQAERLFTAEYGVGPKRFGRIVRLRTAMDLIRAKALPLVDVAAATGYSDQAHLVREFKAMLDITPQVLQRLAWQGGTLKYSFRAPPKL